MRFPLDSGYLEYQRSGSGIPLLFIHGYPLSRKIWQAQLSGLVDIAAMLAVDLRGHGASYPFDGPYWMDLLAKDCYRLVIEQKVDLPLVVCGLSMGGYITFALYRNHPEIFKGMILTSTRAAPDSPEGKVNREAGIKNVREQGVPVIVNGMLPKVVSTKTSTSNTALVSTIQQIMLETSVNGVIGALHGMRDRPDSTPLLAKITCPVLIVHGADDQLIPVAEAELMSRLIPYAQLVVIPDSGHLPNMEQPQFFNQAVRDYLDGLS
ncbi:MAG: alpha/beta hydrolase [Anaerolineales bacterium]|nr:MAG: alpha/beta hydrolase [Anaerolineales bacterium]